MNRKSRSIGRRSSILKIDVNRDDETTMFGMRSKKSSRRVSFAEIYEVKEFPRDSPRVYQVSPESDKDNDEDVADSSSSNRNQGITGLDKLLTGAIQTPYQSVTEYQLPEDSFNIFDVNKTVCGNVDMEMTYASGGVENFYSEMDFQSEPSKEFKIDASSLLKSLHSKPSDRLKTMQLYSPNRDMHKNMYEPSSPEENPFVLNINFSDDKENIHMPMDIYENNQYENQQPMSPVNSQSVLQRLFGDKSRKLGEVENDDDVEMEETTCIGNIVREGKQLFLPKDIGNSKIIGNATKYFHNQDKENEVTKYFDSEDVTMGIEETECVGGILSQGKKDPVMCLQRKVEQQHNKELDEVTEYFDSENVTVSVEETKCVGGIIAQGRLPELDKENSINTDLYKLKPADGMSIPGLQDSSARKGLQVRSVPEREVCGKEKDNAIRSTIEAKDVLYKPDSSDRGPFTLRNQNINDTVYNTKSPYSITGAENSEKMKGNCTVVQPVEMEETTCLTTNLMRNFSDDKVVNKVPVCNSTVMEPCLMEETACLKSGIGENEVDIQKKAVVGLDEICNSEMTVDITVAMEETEAVGEILNRTKSEIDKRKSAAFNVTILQSKDIEETKPVGGILSQTVSGPSDTEPSAALISNTVDVTVAMEETKAIGKILEKSISASFKTEGMKSSDMLNKTVNLTVPVEETKAIGGILNKSSDKTVYFEHVPQDWTCKDLRVGGQEQAADGTVIDRLNVSSGMEETKCVGEILSNNSQLERREQSTPSVAVDRDLNATISEPMQMEETRCATAMVIVSESNNDLMSKTPYTGKLDSTRTDLTSLQQVTMEVTALASGNDHIEYGEEKTVKNYSKRDLSELKREGTPENSAEKTCEITQPTSGLAKLKEKLILSSRKTAAHVRVGDIKTPSKSANYADVSLQRDVTRSPLHKRLKMSSDGPDIDKLETPTTAEVSLTNLDQIVMEQSELQGIDDEQMPDTMHVDLCATGSSNETHSDKGSNMNQEPVNQDTYETRSSSNDTRSSSNNMSMFSNKSFAVSSFVVPEGPLSLESFFKLTFSLVSKVPRTRCSTIFATRVDTEDPVEVMQAELTLKPIVEAKKRLQEQFDEKTKRCEEGMEWMEKMLEETQPEIFQQCAAASDEELEQITGHLRCLLRACNNEVEIIWKQETKEMFSSILHDIQEYGVSTVTERLEKTRSDSSKLDELAASLDKELEDLERKQQKLEDLQKQEKNIQRELAELSVRSKSRSEEVVQLRNTLQQCRQTQDLVQEKDTLLKQIESYLMCVEWNLDVLKEDLAVFTFLDDLLELQVQFIPGVKEKQISNVTFKPTRECRYLEDRVAVAFAAQGINTDSLLKKYSTVSSLQKLLLEVSRSVNEIRQFCMDLEDIHQQHVLHVENSSVTLELWDRQMMDFISLTLTFDPSHPLTSQAQFEATVKIGELRRSTIEDKLKEVLPGPHFFPRLLNAISFKQLHCA